MPEPTEDDLIERKRQSVVRESVYWSDLRRDMTDPEFRIAYESEYMKLTRPSLKARLWRWLVS